jgi:hypothetical protein
MPSIYNIDLTGRTFNKLTVIEGLNEYSINNGCRGYQKWCCRCNCGLMVITNSYQLLRGVSGSCGIAGCGGRNHKEPELIGKKFGKLTVVELLNEKMYGQRAWLCRCDCGNFKKATTAKLNMGQSTNCGCSLLVYKDRSLPAKKYVYADYKRRATLRGLSFEILFEDFCVIIASNCFYCGAPPSNIRLSNTQYRTPGKCTYNGIDRFNNNIGYQKDNCMPCCSTCNTAKGRETIEEFVEYIKKLKVIYKKRV